MKYVKVNILPILIFVTTENLSGYYIFSSAVGGANVDLGYSIIKTADCGFAVVGMTETFGAGSQDVFFAKFDSMGNIQWARTIGGTDQDEAYSLVQSDDGGYIITGRTMSFGSGNEDIFLVKITQSGELEWARAIGEAGNDVGRSTALTHDGGFVITGWTGSYSAGIYDFFLMKLNSLGIVEWAKTVRGVENELGYSIIQTSDRGFAITGIYGADFYMSDTTDCFLAKFDSLGTMQWMKLIGGIYDDRSFSVAQRSDEGFVIVGMCGYQRIDPNSGDLLIVGTSSTGDIEWAKTLQASGNDKASSVKVDADDEMFIAGKISGWGSGWSDLLLMKLDSNAGLMWAKAIGEASYEEAFSVAQLSEELCIVIGETRSFGSGWIDLFITKFSSTGYSCIGQYFMPDIIDISLTSAEVTPDISVIAPTIAKITPVVDDVVPVVTVACESEKVDERCYSGDSFCMNIFPSPFNSSCVIELSCYFLESRTPEGIAVEIYDINGRKVWEERKPPSADSGQQTLTATIPADRAMSVTYNLSTMGQFVWIPDKALPSGIYLIKATAGGKTITQRAMLIR